MILIPWSHACTCGITLLTLLSLVKQSTSHQPYNHQYTNLKNIHRSMKKRDLSRIFGVETAKNVPAYSIVTPYIHREGGHQRRAVIPNNMYPSVFTFGVQAFNKDFKFNLSLNRDLIAPNFKVEVKRKNGSVFERKYKRNCHYSGKVEGHGDSVVGLSACKGLSGLFQVNKKEYFIEPLPSYLHKENEGIEQPHIVYKRNAEEFKDSEDAGSVFSRIWNKNTKRSSSDDASTFVKSDNSERYIETLVVVDQKMVNYHGEDAATQFALVVLNIVASLLRDGSIGTNLIILVVVKLELHTVDVPGLVINHHAANTLESFGTWAAKSSDQDDRSDDHFDYAILLTRYNICADDRQPCDQLGLTNVGGMCDWPNSASVNEDNGLSLAYTVTHNIGHSLGMNHDGDESSFICPDNTYIMASIKTQEWKDTKNLWSRCSRNYLRSFLKKPQAKCLLDPPVKSRMVDYEKMDNKPGILYDVNKQCEMQFGTGSKICHKNQMEGICSKLQCTNPGNPDKCFTSLYPATDGTTCALSKYCYRGECVTGGDLKSTDGGWSSWSDEFSDCSRSCGGGVQYRHRHCNHPKPSNGGKYCEGENRSYRLCAKKACESTTMAHRTVQCSALNKRLFGERKFEWEFKPSKIDSCKLGCFISGTGHGYDFGNVEDGTNCDQTDESVVADKCINGECMTVGCDGVLGSTAKFDRCGVCNGDGSTCATGTDRSEIPEISTGGGGISDALKSLKDMGFDMNQLYGKSRLDLASYSKRSGVARKDDSLFGWSRLKSGCTVSCGGGTETLKPECRRLDDGSPANEERCDKRTQPPVQHYPCSEQACPPIWQTSYWGDCSRTCNGGVKKRNVRCVQRAGNGIEYDVDGTLCVGARPSDTEGCNKESCPTEWVAQPFGECSTICGPGVQVREVYCQKTLKDGSLVTEKQSDCRKETKPPTEQKCNVHNPCPGDAGCGGIYTDSHGNFSSPDYPNNYPNNMECVHIIQVQDSKVIKLQFDAMKIVAPDEKECKNDFVKVMDGDCVSRLGESKFCGKSIPPPFVSTTNRLCIKFYSDDSQNDEGFVASYKAIDKPTQNTDVCGTNYTAPAGLISSPNYPEYYPANEDCNITIATDDKPVKLTFHAFDVGSDDCSNDYVLLSGGEESKKYCGQKLPPVYIGDQVFVRFSSSSRATSMKPGFVATYTSGNPAEKSSLDNEDTKKKKEEEVKKKSEKDDAALEEVQQTLRHAQETLKEASEERKSNIPVPYHDSGTPMLDVPMDFSNPQPSNLHQQHSDIVTSSTNLFIPQQQQQHSASLSNTPVNSQQFVANQQPHAMFQQQNVPVIEQKAPPVKTFSTPILSSYQPIAPQPQKFLPISFVNTAASDEISKDVIDVNPQRKLLTAAEKKMAIALKDDTPAWIPEPAMNTFHAPAVELELKSQLTASLKAQVESAQKTNDVQTANLTPQTAKQIPLTEQTEKKSSYPNPYIPKPGFVIKANQHYEEMKKKSAIFRGLASYKQNEANGVCPLANELRCIRLLLSYPCKQDLDCSQGFACCQTSCEFGTRMCTPKVTKRCPLRDPFYTPRIACNSDNDCPKKSPCCLDMTNRRYCRHAIASNWKQ